MPVNNKFNTKKQISTISGKLSNENDFEIQAGESEKLYPDLWAEDWYAGEDYYIGIGSCKFAFIKITFTTSKFDYFFKGQGETAPSEILSENSLKVLNFFESGCMISILEDVYEELEILKYVHEM